LERIAELGFRIVIFPIGALLVATKAIREFVAEIKKSGTPVRIVSELMSFKDFNDFAGLPEIRELERRFSHR